MPLKAQKNPTRTKCIVEGCATRICSGVKMHGFPREDRYPDLYQHWVDAIRLANKTPLWIPRKSNKVCAFHFETVQNCVIRVPTVFPSIEGQLASTSEEQSYEDFDEDLTAGDYEEDPMDVYEDSMAANVIMEDDGSTYIENSDPTVGYIDEDSNTTYEDIEDTYNTIVGDVVSTLVTDDNVMDEDTNIRYDEEGEDAATAYENGVEEGTTVYNNVEEEIVYDDAGDYIFEAEENSTSKTEVLSAEQIGLNQEELGADDYCVVVIRHEPNETEQESHKEVAPSESDVQNLSISKSEVQNQSISKSEVLNKIISKFKVQNKSCISESEVQNTIISKCKVQNKGISKKSTSKKPSKRGRPRKTLTAAKPLASSLVPCSADKPSEKPAAVPEESSDYLSLSEEVKEMLLKSQESLPSETDTVKLQESEGCKEPGVETPSEKVGIEHLEKESSPLKKSPVERECRRSPSKSEEEKAPTESETKCKDLNGLKFGDLLLDGEPIKLKECSVNIAKTTNKLNNKKKSPTASKVKSTSEEKGVDKEIKRLDNKEMTSSRRMEQDSEENEETLPGSSSDLLNALSLKSTQEEENTNSGLRRSARIRAGAGKRRKFGTRSSWSVAFKDTPKKKLKIEMDEVSQSSESVPPYDFENDDDPDVGVSDLDGSDTTVSESESKFESDISSRSASSNAQPKLNGNATRKWRRGRYAYSATDAGGSKNKFRGYHRVRLGDQATQVGLPGKCDGFIFDVCRDDPRNVGVSCNVFYHYQPKNYRHHSTWARLKRSVETPSTAATKTYVKPQSSTDGSKKEEPTVKHATKTVECSDTAHKPNSKGGKPRGNTLSVSRKSENVECGAASSNRLQNTDEFVEVVEKAGWVDAGETEDLEESAYPESSFMQGGIKVEPAMDVPHNFDRSDSDQVDNVEADGKSRKTGDRKSMSNTAELSELEVKVEEEFSDGEGAEMVRVHRDPCIATDLCKVSHNDESNNSVKNTIIHTNNPNSVGTLDSSSTPHNAASEPGVAHRDNLITEYMDVDDTGRVGSAEQTCSVTVEDSAEKCVDNKIDAENAEETMDTSVTSPHGHADSGNSSDRMDTSAECHSKMTSSSRIGESPNQEDSSRSAENIAAPSMPQIDSSDSGNEADSLSVEDSVVKNGSERGVRNLASNSGEGVIGDELRSITEHNRKLVEPDINNSDSAKSADSPSEAETSATKDAEHDEGCNDLVTSAGPECPGRLHNFEFTPKSPSEAEVSCDLKDARKDRSRDPDAILGCLVESQPVETPSDGTDAKNIKEPEDSKSNPAHPGCEAECQDVPEKTYSAECQGEIVECLNNADFSDDTSNDSLIQIPIPDIDEDSDVREPGALSADCSVVSADKKSPFSCDVPQIHEEKPPQPPASGGDGSPFEGDSANESKLELCHPQSSEKSTDVGKECEAPVADSPNHQIVPSEKCSPAKDANPLQSDSSQDVFDSIERNLEKMFEMDS